MNASPSFVRRRAASRFQHVMVVAMAWIWMIAAAVGDSVTPLTPMGVGRHGHTSTLIQNGNILVVGGRSVTGGPELATVELFNAITGAWSSGPALGTRRQGHTATLLTTGQVLVAGGALGPERLGTAELYDPATGHWAAAGTMQTARLGHSATLLADGRVLLAGGGPGPDFSAAEIFDPTTGSFTATGALTSGRHHHSATLMPTGAVMVVGGVGATGTLASTEVFDPSIGLWTEAASLATARSDHTATLLPGGTVLVAGGQDGAGGSLASVEKYESATGQWIPTGSLAAARHGHTAVLRPNGQVQVVGGGGAAVTSTELYSPTTGLWTNGSAPAVARRAHTATLMPSGDTIILGGAIDSGTATSVVELHEYAVGSIRPGPTMPRGAAGRQFTLLRDGTVLLSGGHALVQAPIANCEIFDPVAGKITAISALPFPRAFHSSTLLPDGRVMIAGGYVNVGMGQETDQVLLYDPVARTWTVAAPMPERRGGHHAINLPSGLVLVVGGVGGPTGSDLLTTALLFDPATLSWTPTGSLAGSSGYVHGAPILLPNGKVLVLKYGGTGICQIYDPMAGRWSQTASPAVQRQGFTATLLPNGRVLMAGGIHMAAPRQCELFDPSSNVWSAAAPMISDVGLHTATLLHTGKVRTRWSNYSTGASGRGELYHPLTNRWSADAVNILREDVSSLYLPDHTELVVGGIGQPSAFLSSTELYNSGLGYSPNGQPRIDAAAFDVDGRLELHGSGFRGLFTAEGGAGARESQPPLVQLRHVESQQQVFVLPDASAAWTDGNFTSRPVLNFPRGYALATVIVGGVPSRSMMVWVPAGEIEVGLAGTGPLQPDATIYFGTHLIGDDSSLTFTLASLGDQSLHELTFLVEGPDAAAFVVSGPLMPSSLRSGTSLSPAVRFRAVRPGAHTATLVVRSSDADEGSLRFPLSGSGLNTPPSLDGLFDQTLSEDAPPLILPFTVGDAESPAEELSVTVETSNPSLVPLSSLWLEGSGARRTLRLFPATNRSGSASITLSVSDGTLSQTVNFTVSVDEVNDPPTLDPIPDWPPLDEGAGLQMVSLSGLGPGPMENQPISLSVTSNRPSLFAQLNVRRLSGSGGVVEFRPGSEASGTAILTVRVNDGAPTNAIREQSFTVVVHPMVRSAAVSQAEGDAGTSAMRIDLTIASPAENDIQIAYATQPGSAVPGNDFLASSGTAVIPAGGTTAAIDIAVVGDSLYEATETFSILLTKPSNAGLAADAVLATITDNDPPPTLTLSDTIVTESDGNATFKAWFLLELGSALPIPSRWTVATRSGTAEEGRDFTALAPTMLTFAPGETRHWVTVEVAAHGESGEGEEEFYLDATAGTWPLPTQSAKCLIQRLAVTQFFPLGSGVYILRFPTGIGQRYIVQEAASLAGPWINNSSLLLGSGSPVTQIAFGGGPLGFFRILASPNAPGTPTIGP